MADLSKYSDEELETIARQEEISSISDEQLASIAGEKTKEATVGSIFGRVPISGYQRGERNIIGNTFERPGAANRSFLRGKGYMEGALNPSKVPTFQNEFQNKVSNLAANIPNEHLRNYAAFMGAQAVQPVGAVADFVTNPADLAMALIPYAPGVKQATQAVGKAISPALKAVGDTDAAQAFTRWMSRERSLPKLKPTIYNDKLVTDTGKAILQKVESRLQPLQDIYETVNKPYSNQIVSSDKFNEALSVIPKSDRKFFIENYSNGILDAKGRPQTTLGNLYKMEMDLKSEVKRPAAGQPLIGYNFDTAEAAKKLKELRISQLPKETQEVLSKLDDQFGAVVEKIRYLIPKLKTKGGSINTKYLYQVFNNPSDSGTREFLNNLDSINIDIKPELKVIKGWVARQGLKRIGRAVGERVVEGATIGTILRGAR